MKVIDALSIYYQFGMDDLSSESTRVYRQSLGKFAKRYGDMILSDLSRRDFQKWKKEMSAQWSVSTVWRHLATTRTFLLWCLDEDEIPLERNPMRKFGMPTKPVSTDKRLLEEDYKRLVNLKPTSDMSKLDQLNALRDRAIMQVLGTTGIRSYELCSLTMDRLDMSKNQIRVYGKGNKRNGRCVWESEVLPSFVEGNGRGRRLLERYVPFPDTIKPALECYFEVRPKHSRFVFPRHWGSYSGIPLNGKRLYDAIRRCARQTMCVGDVSPHLFRHYVATKLVSSGVPVPVVADMFGHEDPNMTATIYSHLDISHIEKYYHELDWRLVLPETEFF